jgi:hypothetical protein
MLPRNENVDDRNRYDRRSLHAAHGRAQSLEYYAADRSLLAKARRGRRTALCLIHVPIGDESMRYHEVLVLSALLAALSSEPGRANSCSQDIDRACLALVKRIMPMTGSPARRRLPRRTA